MPRMRIKLSHILAIPFIVTALQACDSPDDEAELLALDIEDEENLPQDLEAEAEDATDNEKPSVKDFDLKVEAAPAAGPPGKCCKAQCSWAPGVWKQLPQPYTRADNCSGNAQTFCTSGWYGGPGPGWSHVEAVEWRTCG